MTPSRALIRPANLLFWQLTIRRARSSADAAAFGLGLVASDETPWALTLAQPDVAPAIAASHFDSLTSAH